MHRSKKHLHSVSVAVKILNYRMCSKYNMRRKTSAVVDTRYGLPPGAMITSRSILASGSHHVRLSAMDGLCWRNYAGSQGHPVQSVTALVRLVTTTAAFWVAATVQGIAVESASGLYVPGSFGFDAGKTPDPGLYGSTGGFSYRGRIHLYIDGGQTALDVHKRASFVPFAALYVPDVEVFGGRVGFTAGSSYNFTGLDAQVTGSKNVAASVDGWGFGDTILRAQIGWTHKIWSNTFYVTEWIPTGRYDTGFSPNAGKNHYGTNLAWGTTYINQPTKIEFDSVLSLTFNAMNPATNYKNGNELHWDWALGMLFSNNFKLGVAGFVYRQLTGDTGSGATLGPFEGRVYGVGPHLVATVPNGRHPVILTLRYYQEFSAVNRFQGRSITFGTTVKLN